VGGQKTDAKTTLKEREMVMATNGPRCSHSKSLPRSKCCLLGCRWSFLVHRHPSSAVPAAGRYCAPAEWKSRCASPEELQECAAV
jgi:hypothetical protein